MRMTANISDMKPRTRPPRRATNVTLPEPLLAEARSLQINVSQAAESGVARAVAEKRAAQWADENRDAIQSSNAYVEKHGLPLAKYRKF